MLSMFASYMNASEKPNFVFFGLQPTSDIAEEATLVEIAVIITDSSLNILAEGPSIIVHQDDTVLESMKNYFKEKYKRSGLFDKIRNSTTSLADAEEQILNFIKQYTIVTNKSPMVGGMWFGRYSRTLKRIMPKMSNYLSTRTYSTFELRDLAELWNNDTTFQNLNISSAIEDAYGAIGEFCYYKNTYFNVSSMK